MNKVRLKDIAVSQTGPFGSQLHESDYVEVGTPIVTVEHLGEVSFTKQNLPLVSDFDKERLSKYVLKEGDIVFSRVGSVDRCTYVSKNEDGWLFSGRCLRVRVDRKKAFPKFISYYFRQKNFKAMMLNISVGATMPSLNTSLMDNIPLILPELNVQKKIASVLSSLDDKIELNNRINSELEAMAKTIYDYWFVQFDFPDANGKPYKSSGNKMVYNDVLKRDVPEGWEVKSLFDAADVQYGFPFSTEFFNEDGIGFPVIRIRDILENSISNYSTQKDLDIKYKLETGDLLIGMDGNFHINYWSKEGCYLNQRVVRLRKKVLSTICIRYQVEPYIQLREKSVSRTTVGHLSDKDLKAIGILIPTKELRNSMTPLFDRCLSQIITNQKQNQQLSQLRDWLLPMLMNGQVSVADAYQQAAQALSMAAEDAAGYGKKK